MHEEGCCCASSKPKAGKVQDGEALLTLQSSLREGQSLLKALMLGAMPRLSFFLGSPSKLSWEEEIFKLWCSINHPYLTEIGAGVVRVVVPSP